jgi:hypothetical protein
MNSLRSTPRTTRAWPLATAFYGLLGALTLAHAPSFIGVVALVVWLGATFKMTRDPGQVLFVALAVGGVAAVAKVLTGVSSPALGILSGVIACVAIYFVHDHKPTRRRQTQL